MAVGATEAGATANMASDLEAVLSVEDEKNAYERMLAVCENSISEYTKFLEVILSSRWQRSDLDI